MTASPAVEIPSVWARKCPNGDVEIFRDEACGDFFCKFPFYQSNKPDMRQRYVTINCSCWRLRWAPAVK